MYTYKHDIHIYIYIHTYMYIYIYIYIYIYVEPAEAHSLGMSGNRLKLPPEEIRLYSTLLYSTLL